MFRNNLNAPCPAPSPTKDRSNNSSIVMDSQISVDENNSSDMTLTNEVQCSHWWCNKWFKVPDDISIEDFPDVWSCEMRLWDHPGMPGYPQEKWCRKPNNRYFKHLKAAILAKKSVEKESTTLEEIVFTPDETASVAQLQIRASSSVADIADILHEPLPDSIPMSEVHLVPEDCPVDTGDHVPEECPMDIGDHVLEGEARRRNRELAAMCKYLSYVEQWYIAHVGRGMWQEAQLQEHKRKLQLAHMQGRVALFTIDMKSKTVPDKHRAQQGFGMGAKGMSLQGGMLNFWMDGKIRGPCI